MTSEFNELIDELNGKVGAVDEALDASSKNPVTNAATTAGLETKHPIVYDYKELGALGEFHSIASNEDGSVVVFGGDEQGDGLKKPIYCSVDGLKTIQPAEVQDFTELIPAGAVVKVDGDCKWKAISYHKKAKTFVATRARLRYTLDGKTYTVVCVWTSKDGKTWKGKVLDTFAPIGQRVNAMDGSEFWTRFTAKFAYDDSCGVIVVPSNNSFWWSTDCEAWSKCVISTSEETIGSNLDPNGQAWTQCLKLGSVDVISSGKFVAWTECTAYQGLKMDTPATGVYHNDIDRWIRCVELSYDAEKNVFTFGEPVKVSNDLIPSTTTWKETMYFPMSGALEGCSYCGFWGDFPSSNAGILKYDPETKAISLVAYPSGTAGKISCRAFVETGSKTYMLTRDSSGTYALYRFDGTQLVDVGLNNSPAKVIRLEYGCMIGDVCYVCGYNKTDGSALVYTFDTTANVLTVYEYNPAEKSVATLVKQSTFAAVADLELEDTRSILNKVNELIQLLRDGKLKTESEG